jgi:hypothetical protein
MRKIITLMMVIIAASSAALAQTKSKDAGNPVEMQVVALEKQAWEASIIFLNNDPIFKQFSFSRLERERLVGKSEFKNGRGVKINEQFRQNRNKVEVGHSFRAVVFNV